MSNRLGVLCQVFRSFHQHLQRYSFLPKNSLFFTYNTHTFIDIIQFYKVVNSFQCYTTPLLLAVVGGGSSISPPSSPTGTLMSILTFLKYLVYISYKNNDPFIFNPAFEGGVPLTFHIMGLQDVFPYKVRLFSRFNGRVNCSIDFKAVLETVGYIQFNSTRYTIEKSTSA